MSACNAGRGRPGKSDGSPTRRAAPHGTARPGSGQEVFWLLGIKKLTSWGEDMHSFVVDHPQTHCQRRGTCSDLAFRQLSIATKKRDQGTKHRSFGFQKHLRCGPAGKKVQQGSRGGGVRLPQKTGKKNPKVQLGWHFQLKLEVKPQKPSKTAIFNPFS